MLSCYSHEYVSENPKNDWEDDLYLELPSQIQTCEIAILISMDAIYLEHLDPASLYACYV